jgi:hypothetical protein
MTPYYERDGITIYCGETLEVMTYLYEALQLIFDALRPVAGTRSSHLSHFGKITSVW